MQNYSQLILQQKKELKGLLLWLDSSVVRSWKLEAVIPACPESDGFFVLLPSRLQNSESLETKDHSPDISNSMLMKFARKYLLNVGKLYLLFSVIFFFNISNTFCQLNTNLDVFYSLTDSLVNKINYEIPSDEKKILLTLNLGRSYSLFSNSIREQFIKDGREILNQPPDELNIPTVDIVMEGAGVEYGEMFREGFFGAHYVQRFSTIFGNYLQSFSTKGKQDFEITFLDTVKVEDVSSLESPSYPFTRATLPPEPFLSGVAEPLIAIGTAALVIVLFFTIRSE